MFTRKYLLLALSAMAFMSCKKQLSSESLSFDVQLNKKSLSITDTAVFSFSGNPDYITFYSGEPGKNYEFRNRISDTSTNVQLKFSTATTTATSGTLSLLISTDFSGVFDSASVVTANWTDITNRATLATGTTTVASGTVSLADIAVQRKPVYIAFKYLAAASATQRKWTITNFTLDHVLPNKTYTIGNMTSTPPSLGWKAVNVKNSAVNWTTALVITGSTSTATAVDTEDWMIMGPVDLSRVLPDVGVSIKTIAESMSKFPFTYQYTTPGTYNAVFEAGNVNRDASNVSVITVPVTVL